MTRRCRHGPAGGVKNRRVARNEARSRVTSAYEGIGTRGNFALVRYASDGTLDPEFGDVSMVITEVAAPQHRDEAAAVLLHSDERVPALRVIMAGPASGTSNNDFAVTRYWQ
jgi:hypothetical protein